MKLMDMEIKIKMINRNMMENEKIIKYMIRVLTWVVVCYYTEEYVEDKK